MSEAVWLILGGALATYLIRWSGYAVLSRFRNLHPRVVAGLNVMPVAVLVSIVAPVAVEGGFAEYAALATTVILTFAGANGTFAFFSGAIVLFLLRYLFY